MTKRQFDAQAIKVAERKLQLPPGWWGTWRDVHSPNEHRVKFSGYNNVWTIRDGRGAVVSKHDSRAFAISKARKLP